MWFNRIKAESKFCVSTTGVDATDEWLHSFYYFNDAIPTSSEFDKTIGEYLSFEFSMIMQGHGCLFQDPNTKKAQIEHKEIVPLDEKEWKEFFIKDVFTVTQRGKRLTKENQISGDKPYVSSTALNNGVDNFIGNGSGVRTFSNCLTVANSGSVGSSFFHPYEFVASDHVTHLKNEKFNEYTYLFIASIINRFSEKYNFNREINDVRISREKLMLPIDANGRPDYEYMEHYIKNLYRNKLTQYLGHLESIREVEPDKNQYPSTSVKPNPRRTLS